MGQAVTDPKDPNWGLPVTSQSVTDPNWGKPQAQQRSSDSSALVGQAVAASVPAISRGAMEFATSPTAAKTGGAFARGVTTVGAVANGLLSGNPTQVLAAPMEGWAAGKGGYFLTKLAQQVMVPVAKLADAVAPYARGLSTLSTVQGALDLHQMAEPNRKDIGTFGVTMGGGRTDAERQANPALLNQLFASLEDKWHSFMGDYPKELGKQSWNALNPTQRLDAFHTFMKQQTGGGE